MGDEDNIISFVRRPINEWPREVYLADMGDGDGLRVYGYIQRPDDTTPRYIRADAEDPVIQKQRDALTALQAENERLRWEAKCLGETLDAWFDRRKLGHDAVDQAVIDAASGYLRTSRVGGMSNEESDMILDVIQDMARLGLFADLFARAALHSEQSSTLEKGDAP